MLILSSILTKQKGKPSNGVEERHLQSLQSLFSIDWTQVGGHIDGEAPGDNAGHSVISHQMAVSLPLVHHIIVMGMAVKPVMSVSTNGILDHPLGLNLEETLTDKLIQINLDILLLFHQMALLLLLVQLEIMSKQVMSVSINGMLDHPLGFNMDKILKVQLNIITLDGLFPYHQMA